MTTRAYAATSDVPAAKSRGEIESIIERFGASSFAYGKSGNVAIVGFELAGWQYRFQLPLPDPTARRFTITPGRGVRRSPAAATAAYEQEVRSRWRALALIVKAKFAAVEAGISTVEQEFLAQVVLPNGQTVGDTAPTAIARAYATGEVQPLFALPAGPA